MMKFFVRAACYYMVVLLFVASAGAQNRNHAGNAQAMASEPARSSGEALLALFRLLRYLRHCRMYIADREVQKPSEQKVLCGRGIGWSANDLLGET